MDQALSFRLQGHTQAEAGLPWEPDQADREPPACAGGSWLYDSIEGYRLTSMLVPPA